MINLTFLRMASRLASELAWPEISSMASLWLKASISTNLPSVSGSSAVKVCSNVVWIWSQCRCLRVGLRRSVIVGNWEEERLII